MKKKKSNSPIGAQVLRRRNQLRQLAREHEFQASDREAVTTKTRHPITNLIAEFPLLSIINPGLIIDSEVLNDIDKVLFNAKGIK